MSDDSDVELEGVNMESDDEGSESDSQLGLDVPDGDDSDNDEPSNSKEEEKALQNAKEEQREMMRTISPVNEGGAKADPKARLQYLMQQSEVFAHFLSGSNVALTKGAKTSKKSGGSSKKKGRSRMSEAAEDAAMMEAANQVRRVVRVDKQPSLLAKHCKLHPYQLEGLNWMIKLHDNGINGILADEMGLGKTLQTISLLAYLREARGVKGQHLVVVPKSVTGNWIKEIKRWCPTMRAVKLPGTRDERKHMVTDVLPPNAKGKYKWDICITSYEAILKELSFLKKIKWNYLVIDEAHRIKNENSSLSKAVRQLNTSHRMLITGTPLQNNLHELWALLNFLLPDIFGNSEMFDEWFSLDGGEEAQTNVIKKLHTVLKPFMLRRVKKDVAHALPPKKETKLFIGLTDMQVQYYTKILKKESVELNSIGGPAKTALQNVLMQLRKVCNHPYLFTGAEPGPPYSDGPHLWENAGKMQLLNKLLIKLKQQGSRVLIFSQMTRVLDILEDYMNFVGHEYCRIDGNTDGDERDEQMNEFNEDNSSKFCFLLSTRAGGLGINLQTADIVILYDSDWNPQVDLQAMDRAHRIGQKKPVQVFRFVTEGSVEEKITECADRKLFLDAAVIQQGRLAEKSNMDKDEMMRLVKFGAEQIMQSKGATYSDEDIDALLKKGEERTEAMNAKLQTDVQHNLATFSLMGDEDESDLYKFGGVDHKSGGKGGGMMINLGQRERKKLYELDTGPVVVPVSKEVLAQRRKMRKRDAMKDFQFFDKAALQAYFTKEENLEEDKAVFVRRIAALRDEAKEAPSVKSEKVEVEKGKSYEEINAKADKMQDWLDGEGSLGKYSLTEEELKDKERLIDEGFGDWSLSDFRLFTTCLEIHGRYDVEAIAEEFLDQTVHSKETVYKYYITFMRRYKEIKDYGRIWEKCDRALEKAIKEKRTKVAMEWFYEGITEQNFWKCQLPMKGVAWSEEEDKFLIYCLWKYGTKNTETIRAAIHMSPRFRFNLFFRLKTASELAKRINRLVGIIEESWARTFDP
ncbi:hypothetical protein TrRE_jg13380, partial [Triparma retinervis]